MPDRVRTDSDLRRTARRGPWRTNRGM